MVFTKEGIMLAPSFSAKPTPHFQAKPSVSNPPRFGGKALEALQKENAALEAKRVQEKAAAFVNERPFRNTKNGRTMTTFEFLEVFDELRLQGTRIDAADDDMKLKHANEATERAKQLEVNKKNKSFWKGLVAGFSQPVKVKSYKAVVEYFSPEDHALVEAIEKTLVNKDILQLDETQGIQKLNFTPEGKKVWDAMKVLNKPSSSNTSIDLLS
jgi:hypothetical protein